MADPTVQQKLQAPQGRVRKLMDEQKDDNKVLDELFLGTVSRLPTAKDRTLFAEVRARGKDRQAAFFDTMWALINTNEFVFNH
jgi:hypothetical protein